MTSGLRARASSTRSSTTSKKPEATSRKSDPSRLITATGVPSVDGATASARPGEPEATFAGRITRSEAARYGPMSSRAQT